jgi:hypothetical protein
MKFLIQWHIYWEQQVVAICLDVIVVELGTQKVNCNVDSSRKGPEINNKVMHEYARYREATKAYDDKRTSFEKEERELIEKYPNGIPETLKVEMEMKIQSLYTESDLC